MRKSQITPERKQRKKIFFNSICTPLEHPDSPQSLYLWAFSQFSPLLKLLGGEIYLAVSWHTFVCFILHIHLISHFCVPHLKFLEPKWSQNIVSIERYFHIKIAITNLTALTLSPLFSLSFFLQNPVFLY